MLDDEDRRLVARLVREGVNEAMRGKLSVPTMRPGNVDDEIANGQLGPVWIDGDLEALSGSTDAGESTIVAATATLAVEPEPTLCINATGASVVAGERVLVTFSNGVAWITHLLTRNPTLPAFDQRTTNVTGVTGTITGSGVICQYEQHIAGRYTKGHVTFNFDCTAADNVFAAIILDAGGGTEIRRTEFIPGVANLNDTWSWFWVEAPDAGIIRRELWFQRLAGAGTGRAVGAATRPITMLIEPVTQPWPDATA